MLRIVQGTGFRVPSTRHGVLGTLYPILNPQPSSTPQPLNPSTNLVSPNA